MRLSFRIKFTLVITLLLATILNYLDRQTISILAPTLQHQMGLSNAHLGWLFAISIIPTPCFSLRSGQCWIGSICDGALPAP